MSDLYARIENGVVRYLGGLPRSYENVSGFRMADSEMLKEYGFIPAEEDHVSLDSDEVPDGYDLEMLEDRVVIRYKKRKMTDQEYNESSEQKWKMLMKESDEEIPRWGEDIFFGMSNAAKGRVPKVTRDKIEAKGKLRASRPRPRGE